MCGSVIILLIRSTAGISVTVADVGQGDGILIEADGTRLMIDGGSTSKSSLAEYQLKPLLFARGAGTIDLWILTHDDKDHCSGLLDILAEDGKSGIIIRRLLLPDIANETKSQNFLAIEDAAHAQEIPITYIHEGMDVQAGKLCLCCLHPESGASYADPNAYSTVLFLSYGRFTALFTGDLEGNGEADMLTWLEGHKDEVAASGGHFDRQGKLHVNLLKTAHHGSKGATSSAFLEHVTADLAVISCGVDNRYGHPHKQTLENLENAGIQIYDTRYTGEVTFHSDGRTLKVRAFGGELSLDT